MDERGCVRCPGVALHGILLCHRCTDRIRDALDTAPVLVGQLGVLLDPRRAQLYNQEPISRTRLVTGQAPMSLDIIDARDHITATMVKWAKRYGDPREYLYYSRGVPATATPETAAAMVRRATEWVTTACDLDYLRDVGGLARDLLGDPDDPTAWSVVRARGRFMPPEKPEVIKGERCPSCTMRTIRRTPAGAHGEDVAYDCLGCGWTPPAAEYEWYRSLFDDGVRA